MYYLCFSTTVVKERRSFCVISGEKLSCSTPVSHAFLFLFHFLLLFLVCMCGETQTDRQRELGWGGGI